MNKITDVAFISEYIDYVYDHLSGTIAEQMTELLSEEESDEWQSVLFNEVKSLPARRTYAEAKGIDKFLIPATMTPDTKALIAKKWESVLSGADAKKQEVRASPDINFSEHNSEEPVNSNVSQSAVKQLDDFDDNDELPDDEKPKTAEEREKTAKINKIKAATKTTKSRATKTTGAKPAKVSKVKEPIVLENGQLPFDALGVTDSHSINEFVNVITKCVGGIRTDEEELPKMLTYSTDSVKPIISETDAANVVTWEIQSMKIDGKTGKNMKIKYKLYFDDENEKSSKKSKITREVLYSLDDIDDADNKIELSSVEEELVETFRNYVDALHTFNKKNLSIEAKPALINSDLMYALEKMEISNGFFDKHRNLIIGNYQIGYNFRATPEFEYKDRDYNQLFNCLRTTHKNYRVGDLLHSIWKIYNMRYPVIYHEKCVDLLETKWNEALDLLKKADTKNEAIKMWIQVLSSNQCKNIILKGFPASTIFTNYMKKLLTDVKLQSWKLLIDRDLLWGISPIFTPFAIMLNKLPEGFPKEKKNKLYQRNVDIFQYELVKSNDVTNYNDYYWMKELVDDMQDEEECSFCFRLKQALLSKPTKKTTAAKKEETKDEDDEEIKENSIEMPESTEENEDE